MKWFLTLLIFLALKFWEVVVVPLREAGRGLWVAVRATAYGLWVALRWACLLMASVAVLVLFIYLGVTAADGEGLKFALMALAECIVVATFAVRLMNQTDKPKTSRVPDWQVLFLAARWVTPRFPIAVSLGVLAFGACWLDWRGAPQWMKSLTSAHMPLPAYHVVIRQTNVRTWETWRNDPEQLTAETEGRPATYRDHWTLLEEKVAGEGGGWLLIEDLRRATPLAGGGDGFQVRNLKFATGYYVGAPEALAWYAEAGPHWLATPWGATNRAAVVVSDMMADALSVWKARLRANSWIQRQTWVANNSVSSRETPAYNPSYCHDTAGPGLPLLLLFVAWTATAVVWTARRSWKNERRERRLSLALLPVGDHLMFYEATAGVRRWLASNWKTAQGILAGTDVWPWQYPNLPEVGKPVPRVKAARKAVARRGGRP